MRTASSTSRRGSPRGPDRRSPRWAIFMPLSTSAKSVGSTYQPFGEAGRAAAAARRAGAFLACRPRCSPRRGRAGARRPAARRRSSGRRVADLHARASAAASASTDLVVARPRREDAGLRDAGLAVVHDAAGSSAGDRAVDVGVVEHDRRRLAAELERAALQTCLCRAKKVWASGMIVITPLGLHSDGRSGVGHGSEGVVCICGWFCL